MKKPGYSFGSWYCTHCGGGYSGQVVMGNIGKTIELKKEEVVSKTCYDLLVLPPQTKPVYFILRRSDYGNPKYGEYRHLEFLYNEHTCPTNWIGDVVGIVIGDDPDPHGLFKFVGRTYQHAASAENIHHNNNYPFGYEFISRFYPSVVMKKG